MQIKNQGRSVAANNGVVATSQPLAAEAGLNILKLGGNAVDAAISTAIALTVVEPTSNGIGGDAFALVWDGNKLQGLNASGRSAAGLDATMVKQQGYTEMPELGWMPVTVPGAPSAWQDLHQRYGRLPLAQLFEPAIELAEKGFEVTPVVAFNWVRSVNKYSTTSEPSCANWMNTFSCQGRAPAAGETWTCTDQAQTLRTLSREGIESFYRGELAAKIIGFSQATGGYLTEADLARHENLWVDPVSTNYRGVDVCEIPPNGQGLAALIALAILDGKDLASLELLSTEALHLQIEAMKLGCVDAYQYIGDPAQCANMPELLLDSAYIDARAKLITEQSGNPSYGTPPKAGTVYLCTADSDGMMVSLIQSNYEGFGSGVVIPGTGIAMQNRGACFSLEQGHVNVLAGGKRCFHTIIPGFLMCDGKPVGPFGVMAGFMQPQGHLQVVSAMVDHGLDPQAALDLPRWRIIEGRQLEMEAGITVCDELEMRGHEITVPQDNSGFGRGQIILKTDDGYLAGSEPRADGLAMGY